MGKLNVIIELWLNLLGLWCMLKIWEKNSGLKLLILLCTLLIELGEVKLKGKHLLRSLLGKRQKLITCVFLELKFFHILRRTLDENSIQSVKKGFLWAMIARVRDIGS